MFSLQVVEISRGLVEQALEFVDAASCVIGSLSLGLGLLPQLVVAAEQVVEQPLEFGRIEREAWRDAHT